MDLCQSGHEPNPSLQASALLPLPNTEPPPPPPVMSLNDDCLEYVMKYLKLPDQLNFARTCLRFRAVYEMATPRLHKSINLFEFAEMTVRDMRDFFRLCGAYVETVNGVMLGINAQGLFEILADSCENLKTMDMRGHMSVHSINKMFANKSQLESLKLDHANICDRCVLELRNLRKLKELNLSGNPLTGDTLVKLPCTIESLTLDYCENMEIRNLMKVLKTFHWLKELNIKGIDPNGSQIYEQIIMDKCCMALETVRMTGYGHIRYEFVAQIPNLKHLSVFIPGQELRGELFKQLAEHKATKLEYLEVVGGKAIITKEMLFNIGKLRELQSLTLPGIEGDVVLVDALGSNGVVIQEILKLFGACRRLSYIRLGNYCELNEALALGIVSRVQQEIANKDMHRKLPIELCFFRKIGKYSDKIPKDIIQTKGTIDAVMRGEEDFSFDEDELGMDDHEDTDDSVEMFGDDMKDWFKDNEDDFDDPMYMFQHF